MKEFVFKNLKYFSFDNRIWNQAKGHWSDSLIVRCNFFNADGTVKHLSPTSAKYTGRVYPVPSPISSPFSSSCLDINYQRGQPLDSPNTSQLNFLNLNSFKIEQIIKIKCENRKLKNNLIFKKFNKNIIPQIIKNDCQHNLMVRD